MLTFGYTGETDVLEEWIGFIFDMYGWFTVPLQMIEKPDLEGYTKTVSAGMF